MNYRELSEISQAQIKALMQTNESLQLMLHSQSATLKSQSATLKSQSETIQSLSEEIKQLKEILLTKDKSTEKIVNKLNGLSKIAFSTKTEKRKPEQSLDVSSITEVDITPTPKERGNNRAKRKVYENLEEIREEVDPTHPEFVKNKAQFIDRREVIRYKYIPSKLIKHIYMCNKYSINGTIYEGKAPIAPLLNSNFDSSVLASLIQQRFVYGLPVERIVKQYNEFGVDLPKQTAHGLLLKAADILDRLNPVLKDVILSDNYLHFDETYHTFIDNRCENGSRKGYFWAVLSSATNLIHLFTADGSRSKKVFTDYLPRTYSGAIQTDGYSSYKVIEGWTYSKAIRLGCIQHCKRKFIEIEQQKEAKEIIDIYNEFYHLRNTIKKDKWVDASLKVYDKLKRKLRELEKDKMIICNSILSKAVAYSLNELDSIRNIIISTDYDLDNNQIERPMRYISISRKNSMFCGSGKSAARLALIYSLAISCRLNGVNSFEYFCDIINRLAELPPNVSNEKLRELLPDKWSELK